MIKVEGFYIKNNKIYRTLKFMPREITYFGISLVKDPPKDCEIKEEALGEIREKFNGSVRDYLLSKGKFLEESPCKFIGVDLANGIDTEVRGHTKNGIHYIDSIEQKTKKPTKVELEIDFPESDEILLGELDYFLRSRFNIKKIKVGKENINYK